MGFFKPAWTGDNKEKALGAVEKTTDQTTLAQIANGAVLPEVRRAAVNKIADQYLIAGILKKSPYKDIREMAAGKLTNQAALAEAAKNDGEESVRLTAFERLTDESFIADVIKDTNDEFAIPAAARLTDQDILADAARKAVNWKVRESAIANLEDNGVLADIAKKDRDAGVCLFAVKQITDQTALEDVAKRGKSSRVRVAAVEKLTSREVLTNIALNDGDFRVREAALANEFLGDRSVRESVFADVAKKSNDINACKMLLNELDERTLFDIAMNAVSLDMRKEVIDMLTDQPLIERVARENDSESTRLTAVRRIKDPAIIRRVADDEVSEYVREVSYAVSDAAGAEDYLMRVEAMKKLVTIMDKSVKDGDIDALNAAVSSLEMRTLTEKLTDETFLADIALNDSRWGIRRAAAEKLTEQAVLTHILKNDDEVLVKLTAIGRIKEQSILAEAARGGEYPAEIRKSAIERLTDQTILELIANADSDNAIRYAAFKKVSDPDITQRLRQSSCGSDNHFWETTERRDDGEHEYVTEKCRVCFKTRTNKYKGYLY